MATKRLNAKEIERLLSEYRSERRRLIFQLDRVRDAIADLKGLPAASGGEGTAAKKKSGGPAKKAAVKRGRRRKPGRKKSRAVKGGYRLSPWDLMVVDLITKRNRMLPKADIMAQAVTWAKKNEPGMKEADVEAKLTRVLQKLSGKRGVLGTHRTGLRRGYHYGLKEWFFASTGKMRPGHLDKLVI
ncbi:MAG: hypothetical protein KIT10_01490 [Flavobacteriales bacterium]|nr:hypothetical protein [Flavobacteriales bacterium]